MASPSLRARGIVDIRENTLCGVSRFEFTSGLDPCYGPNQWLAYARGSLAGMRELLPSPAKRSANAHTLRSTCYVAREAVLRREGISYDLWRKVWFDRRREVPSL